MTKFTLTATAFSLFATSLLAGQTGPGSHFIENWDLDEDGQVTLSEATERRSDIFVTFDENDDGTLSAAEYDMFDEARANDMKENGLGQGRGKGKGKNSPANGMLREFTDTNSDGVVTRAEFMDSVPAWYARMDKNSDGTVTTDDFGRGH